MVAEPTTRSHRAWAEALFRPRSVAVVGATARDGKVGQIVMRNLLAAGSHAVYPVNPSSPVILGRPTVASLRELREPVDLVVIVVPPEGCLTAVEDAGAVGARAAVVITGGFAELGPEGRARQDELVAAARRSGLRLLGPNCFGVVDAPGGLNASIGLGLPAAGGVSLVTQSGAYGMAAFSRSQLGEIGFAKVVAPGNAADLGIVDLLDVLADDPETRVIALLLESVGEGRALIDAVGRAAERKPVVVLKTGRAPAGRRAAASHTAALAADDAIATAALRQAGARVVGDGLTLLDVAAALDRQAPPRGPRVAIVTNSGGTGVELADLLSEAGLDVPLLSDGLRSRIGPALPPTASTANPIDITVDWARYPAAYGEAVRELLRSGEVDAVVPVLLQRSALMPEVAERIVEAVVADRAQGGELPVHVCWVAPPEAEDNRRRLLAAGIPCHEWPARTARVLAACRTPPVWPRPQPIPEIPAPDQPAEGWLDVAACFGLLEQAGIPTAPWRVAASVEAVPEAASAVGCPCVVKAALPSSVHKSDIGAIRLGLGDPIEAQRAAAELRRSLGATSFLVQRLVGPGVELLVGVVRDPGFGPVITVGLGGIWVEALADVAMRLAPIGEDEALSMLDELRGRRVLDGLRGRPAADRAALGRLIARVSQMAAASPWLAELDLNPVIADPSGAVVVDARARVAREG
jgi:acetyltransferase